MIFISSPYAGDTETNVERARAYCRYAINEGYMPVAPHLLYPQVLDDNNPEERELGLRFGLALLSLCDEIWCFGSPSPGMEAELAFARERHIPIKMYPAGPEKGNQP